MNTIKVSVSKLAGMLKASPSKSHSLRAILFASMAHGKSTISNVFRSPDADAMIAACRQLGAKIWVQGDVLSIQGVGAKPIQPASTIDVGNSGQVLRFVAAIAALLPGKIHFTGDESIQKRRPMVPLLDGLNQLGAHCASDKGNGFAPLTIQGPVKPGTAEIEGIVSQPVSALLMLTACLDGQSIIKVKQPQETPWTALTVNWLLRLGVDIACQNESHFVVNGRGGWKGFDYTVPGDFSGLAFPAAAALVTHSSIIIEGIDWQDSQGDKAVFDCFECMGAKLVRSKNTLRVMADSNLVGTDIDVNGFADAVPILAVLACYAKGETRLLNADVARLKESDRMTAMCTELSKMGAKIRQSDSALIIEGCELIGVQVDSWLDHRIAMALIVAGLGAKGDTMVQRTDCIAKSYGKFVEDMRGLNASLEVIVK